MTIEHAIAKRHILAFDYDGFHRTVEPHTYGIDRKGHRALRAYQTGGGSDSGEIVGWKLFHEHDMHSMRDTGQSFAGPRPDYRRGDRAFQQILAEL